MEEKEIKDSHVLVTGANRGIGRAFVLALLARGAGRIYATARDVSSLGDMPGLGSRVLALQLDVTRPADIARVKEALPRLDLLINNAGTATASGYSSDMAFDIAHREMDTNYFGPLRLCNALLPQLRASKQAGIINVSSIAGIANFKQLGPYSASKAAVHFLTQGLRAELRPDGISVVGVYPGPVDTRMAAGIDIPKADPVLVVRRVLDAYEDGVEDIYPDDFSRTMAEIFRHEPKELERAFAS